MFDLSFKKYRYPYWDTGIVHEPITAAIGSILGTTLFTVGGTAVTLGSVLLKVGITLALGLASSLLTPQSPDAPSTATQDRGYQVTTVKAASPHQIVYGRAKVGGVVVAQFTTGKTNQQLHQVIAFAGHEIDSFDEIYFDNWKVRVGGDGFVNRATKRNGKVKTDKYNDVYIEERLGTDNQRVVRPLTNRINRWNSDCRLRGIAYLYVRFIFDGDVYANGVPNVTATIKGRKVYDPRDGSTEWSDNAALCIRDYLTADFGLNEDDSAIDDDLVQVAANKCFNNIGNTSINKYEINGAFLLDSQPKQILENMAKSMAGTIWYAQGKWRMKPGYWTNPVLDLTEDDLRSSVSVQTRHSRRNNFNAVKGTFRGEETNWQVADYKPILDENSVIVDTGSDEDYTYLDLDLPFTSIHQQARFIAKRALERKRQQIIIDATFGMKAFAVQVGDNVRITNERFGWSNKEFEVISWTFTVSDSGELIVPMTLQETSERVFTGAVNTNRYERDNTDLPSPFEGPEVGVNLETELRIINQEVTNVLIVNVGSDVSDVEYFEVQYRASGETKWKSGGYGSSTTFEIYNLKEEDYDVRVRGINTFSVKGDWTTITNFRVDSVPTIPADVTGLSANIQRDNLILAWNPVSTLTLSHYEIRYSPTTDTTVPYSDAVVIVDRVPRPATSVTVPTRSGTYLIKAVDKKGTRSASADSVVLTTDINDVLDLNVVETLQESPDFQGTVDDTVVVQDENNDNYLTLDSQGLFDSGTGLFDDASGLFDSGFTDAIFLEGTYEFSDVIDLGAKFVSRVSTNLEYISVDDAIDFDSAGGLFDVRPGDFDGDPDQLDNATAFVEISTTDDDPTGTPTWSPWNRFISGDISSRAYRFRAVLQSDTGSTVPQVTGLSAQVDMPDRVVAEDDIDVTGTANISFTSKFYTNSTPAVGIGLTGLATGDYYEITSKDNEGFTITLYDSTDTQLTNTVQLDYVAKGYGKEVT